MSYYFLTQFFHMHLVFILRFNEIYMILKKLLRYLNPIEHFGEKKYSVILPIITTITVAVLIEIYIHFITKDTAMLGFLAIFIFVALIIYFSFREGIVGGVAASLITVAYYIYIIYSLHYKGEQYTSGIQTTIVLGVLYLILSGVIGGLRQIIDSLIEKEVLAREAAEEGELRLQTILQQLPVGVLIGDLKKQTFQANEYLEKILGGKINTSIQRDKNYISPLVSLSKKALEINEWPIMRALYDGEIVVEEELEFTRRDKKHLYLLVSAAPIISLHGKIVAAVSTIYDMTQIKELELRKDDFVNIASHELKTPVTSITLYVDSLLKKVKTSEDLTIKKAVKGIKTQTIRMQKLVNDLLDVSRLQTGKLSITKGKFRIDTLIFETIENLQATTHQKILFEKSEQITVFADRLRIYQVLSNLLNNAIKYSLGKNNIVVSLRKEDSKVIVSVTDYGIGIPRNQQKKVFSKLYQVTDEMDAMSKTFPGFGMGLYIAKEILKIHKGDVWVKSTKGLGSTFYFSLPEYVQGRKNI